MSTHTYPTTDAQQTTTQTDSRTSDQSPASRPTYQPTIDRGETTPADDRDSWVARCQRQFDSRETQRLRNCIDDQNHALPTPTDP